MYTGSEAGGGSDVSGRFVSGRFVSGRFVSGRPASTGGTQASSSSTTPASSGSGGSGPRESVSPSQAASANSRTRGTAARSTEDGVPQKSVSRASDDRRGLRNLEAERDQWARSGVERHRTRTGRATHGKIERVAGGQLTIPRAVP